MSVLAGSRIAAALFTALCIARPLAGQATGPMTRQLAGIVAPSDVRLASGRPGPRYWQQRADYRIDATLDPVTETLRGTERITYRNNAPESIPHLWMHVEQNICAKESLTNQLNQPPLVFLSTAFDFSCQGFDGGLVLESVKVNGSDAKYLVTGTTMRVDLARSLASGGTLTLDIVWRFRVPPYGAGRMGHDGTLYELGQWYPRMAVYDDVKGWNADPYIGGGEFYLEYGRFDVNITVPFDYVVAATGTLKNPDDVLTPAQRERLARARTSDAPVAIIGDEVGTDATRPETVGTQVWRFTADSVRDFAFAAAPNFWWDASG